MIDEVLVELAQGFSRGLLIVGSNLSGHLPTPQEVVANNDGARTEFRQCKVQVAAVLLLHRIDEEEVKRLFEAGNDFERKTLFDADALTQTRSGQIIRGAGNHFVAGINR